MYRALVRFFKNFAMMSKIAYQGVRDKSSLGASSISQASRGLRSEKASSDRSLVAAVPFKQPYNFFNDSRDLLAMIENHTADQG